MILSIDLDIIMEPCIQLYNRDVKPGEVGLRHSNWDTLYKTLDLKRHLSINKDNLDFIFSCLTKLSKRLDHVYVGNDHSCIINAINQEYTQHGLKIPVDIVNIDHHHDIAYSLEQEDMCLKYGEASCSSWVFYLNLCKAVNSYIWVNNPNSELYKGTTQIDGGFVSIDKFKFIESDYDMLFFTPSLPWIPLEYDDVYLKVLTCMESLWKNKINYITQPFINDPVEKNIFKQQSKYLNP